MICILSTYSIIIGFNAGLTVATVPMSPEYPFSSNLVRSNVSVQCIHNQRFSRLSEVRGKAIEQVFTWNQVKQSSTARLTVANVSTSPICDCHPFWEIKYLGVLQQESEVKQITSQTEKRLQNRCLSGSMSNGALQAEIWSVKVEMEMFSRRFWYTSPSRISRVCCIAATGGPIGKAKLGSTRAQ